MEKLLVHPENSLLAQSKHSQKRKKSVNGDGFGVGWYPLHDDPEPGLFVSIEPAWSNKNLKQISSKIVTRNFFAHVRDASEEILVSQANCHPFSYGKLLWMHNGQLEEFSKIKRDIVRNLSDQAFCFLQGGTDSEYAFAIFLEKLNFNDQASPRQMRQAMIDTIEEIMFIRKRNGAHSNALMNFAVTNGETTLVTRFVTLKNTQGATLFYTQAKISQDQNGDFSLRTCRDKKDIATIISSEPLNDQKQMWTKIEPNFLIEVDNQQNPVISKIDLPFQKDI